MSKLKSPLILYGLSGLLVIVAAFSLKSVLPKTSFLYTFFFNSWPIQFLSTWLFFLGILYWCQRYSLFKKEELAFQKSGFPEISILRKDVPLLLQTMPQELKLTLSLRRFQELLQAFVYGEDVIRLNEELSRRDMADVERGHLTLDILRNLIPVIGFLGTVVGLSFAMLAFPQVSDPLALKEALRNFAASLSVAFNTTLLALGFTIVIIMLTSYLRQREESLVSEVDSRARKLIEKIKVNPDTWQVAGDGDQKLKLMIDNLMQHGNKFSTDVINAINESSKTMANKFDELKEELKKPPQYQVVVHPLQDNRNE